MTFLRREKPVQIEAIEQLFVLADACIDAYEAHADHLYSKVCGLTYSSYSLAHLTDPTTKQIRKLQVMNPAVLERNVGDFAIQFVLMLQESVLSLEHSPDRSRMESLARQCDEIRGKVLEWFPSPPGTVGTGEKGSTP